MIEPTKSLEDLLAREPNRWPGAALSMAVLILMVGTPLACSERSETVASPHGSEPTPGVPAAPDAHAVPIDGSVTAPRDPAAPSSDAAASAPVRSRDAMVPPPLTPKPDRAPASPEDAGGPPELPQLCRGCASEQLAEMDMTVHVHHVHLNVADRARTETFYEMFLAAERVLLNGTSEALHVNPILLLLDETESAPHSQLPSALQHIGWGSSDVAAWYADAHQRGVPPDTRKNTLFNTNESPTVGAPGSAGTLEVALGIEAPACFPDADQFSYMYVLGPDQERIEIWTGADQRVNHIHLTTPDLPATVAWYRRFLGLSDDALPLLYWGFFMDDILFFFEPVGDRASYAATDDHVLGHLAFSVTNLRAWLQRARDQGITIVSEPASAHGFESFFIRGPDGLLIELVQAAKSPDLCPETP